MPTKAPRICGCGYRVASGAACACEERRARERKARFDKTRPSARERGYDGEWRRESKAFLALPQNQFCACGCGRVATLVDHKIPHRGNKRLFWDRANWQPLNSHCHNSAKQSEERRKPRGS